MIGSSSYIRYNYTNNNYWHGAPSWNLCVSVDSLEMRLLMTVGCYLKTFNELKNRFAWPCNQVKIP
jgi:hypothetical protein